MGLDEYHRKRDFSVTAEPPGRARATATGRSFVVQKHAARRLHYDFRLELDGVLKSWSIPKGPCFDPAIKRLAVAVEDHPIEYGDFEGIIPAGQYGGGTVLLWDRGTWQPLSDPAAALAKGHLKFELLGEKLRGRWALVRLGAHGRGAGNDERSWLLVKDRDSYARSESEWSVTAARPESVATGRALEAIAASPDRVWHSARGAAAPGALAGARAAALPPWVQPAQAQRRPRVPDGEDWLHEIEIVGERILIRVDGGRAKLLGIDQRERERELAGVAAAARTLPVRQALVDGVATALAPDGRSGADRPADTLFVLDLLHLDGYDLTQVALVERKNLLASLVTSAAGQAAGGLRYADHVSGRGREAFARASALGATGMVSKRQDSHYPPGASEWRVVRCRAGQARARAPEPASAPVLPRKAAARETRLLGVKLTHPERMLYPAAGITKLDLARFYERVAERMLPYLVDRPLTLVRAPAGITGHRFFVRHAGDWAPRELRQVEVVGDPGAGRAMIVDDVRGLVALAQMNVLEVHPWSSRTRALDRPDRVVFDLDPGPEVPWSDVVDGAKRVRDVLQTLGLASFVKTTGGKGLHVVVPLTPAATWEEVLDFSRVLAQVLERFEPTRFSAGLAKAGRTRKIFVDYLRNRRGATAVGAYSSRAHPTGTVSVPVAWDDLGFGTRSDAFHVGDVDRWYTERDPWADYGKTRQRLTAAKLKAAHATLARAPFATPAWRA